MPGPSLRGRALIAFVLVAGVAVAVAGLVAGGNGARATAPPTAHVAAVCADYPDQAAAQQAADTRDADGDGIYCESLPCPCSSAAGGGGATTPSRSRKHHRVKLGPSVLLAPATQHAGCRIHGSLPDAACTPGAHFKYVTTAKVCTSGYSRNVRNVTAGTKNAVYAAYGMTTHFDGASGEVDHLVSLELGGSNSRYNLFPEAARPAPGSHEKDELEDRLHSMVCDGDMRLGTAQRDIAHDWVTAFRKYVVG